MAAPSVWLCPRCQRRVPRREAACFCGCSREQAEREQHEQRQRSAARPTRELVLTLTLTALLVGLFARRLLEPPPAASPALPVPVAARPRPGPAEAVVAPPPDAEPTPSAETAPPAASAPPLALPAAAPAAPEPTATPTPVAELARAELRAAYAALQPLVDDLEKVLSDYESRCVGTHVGVTVSNCDEMQAWLAEHAQRLQVGLTMAEEQARRQRALPGDVRGLREELGVARWEELAGRARVVH